MLYKFINRLFMVMLTGILFSCTNTGTKKKVTIAYVNWAEGNAMTQLSKVLLEREGYTVELKNADVAPVFAAVARGDADMFLDSWMPVTHKDYMEKYGSELEVSGINFNHAQIGFVVPDYVNINSIVELNSNASLFDHKIIGIDAGAGIMNKAELAVKNYNLKLELQSSSEAAMLAILKKSIDKKQAVVVTGWSPHYMFSNFKLKFLKDPKAAFGSIEKIQTISNKKFAVSNPMVASFFRNFQLDEEQLGSLMAALEGTNEERTAVEGWLNRHQDFSRNMSSFLKTSSSKEDM
nr:glycine betaine ABC transporter substrate-binding protein [Pedobacter sp. ASV19]